MHTLLYVPALYAAFTFAVHPATAQPVPTATQQHASTLPDRDATGSATRIEVDDRVGTIRFFVDGEEAMRLDANGLHVRGNIGFGGTLTDFDRIGFDELTAQAGGDRDAP